MHISKIANTSPEKQARRCFIVAHITCLLAHVMGALVILATATTANYSDENINKSKNKGYFIGALTGTLCSVLIYGSIALANSISPYLYILVAIAILFSIALGITIARKIHPVYTRFDPVKEAYDIFKNSDATDITKLRLQVKFLKAIKESFLDKNEPLIDSKEIEDIKSDIVLICSSNITDGWNKYYEEFEYNHRRYPNANALIIIIPKVNLTSTYNYICLYRSNDKNIVIVSQYSAIYGNKEYRINVHFGSDSYSATDITIDTIEEFDEYLKKFDIQGYK